VIRIDAIDQADGASDPVDRIAPGDGTEVIGDRQ
jgi:hypothetical protein